jgi:hypothetical protein
LSLANTIYKLIANEPQYFNSQHNLLKYKHSKQMALKKRKPGLIVNKAEKRLSGMKKIDLNYKSVVDFGGPNNPLSSKDMKNQIKRCIEINDEYNEALRIANERASILKEEESRLGDMYSRVLPGCISRFGSDASEIKVLGGTRKSERKKPFRKKS